MASSPRYHPCEPLGILRVSGGSAFQGHAEPRGPLHAEPTLGIGADPQPLAPEELPQGPARELGLAGERDAEVPETPLERRPQRLDVDVDFCGA